MRGRGDSEGVGKEGIDSKGGGGSEETRIENCEHKGNNSRKNTDRIYKYYSKVILFFKGDSPVL